MTRFLISSLLVFVLTFAGTREEVHAAPASSKGRLRGIVFSGASGKPLRGVTITLGKRRIVTDRDGGFSFFAPPGKLALSLSLPQTGTLRTSPIPVVGGEVTEALITVYQRRGALSLKVEAAVRKRQRRLRPAHKK